MADTGPEDGGYERCVRALLRDGRRPADAALRDWLARHPKHAGRARREAAARAALHERYDRVLEEPIPQRLLRARGRDRARSVRRAGALAAVALAGLSGWWLHAPPTADSSSSAFATQVLRLASDSTPMAEAAETGQRPAGHAPDAGLAAHGFRRVGVRRWQDSHRPVTEYVYRNDSGDRLRLFARHRAQAPEALRVRQRDGVALAQWHAHGTDYALVGNLPADSIRRLAESSAEPETPGTPDRRAPRPLPTPGAPTTDGPFRSLAQPVTQRGSEM